MKTVAPLLMARMASLCKEVLAGRTPLARRWTIVRGRDRSCWPGQIVSHEVLRRREEEPRKRRARRKGVCNWAIEGD